MDVLVQKDQSRQMTTKTDTVLIARPSACRNIRLGVLCQGTPLAPVLFFVDGIAGDQNGQDTPENHVLRVQRESTLSAKTIDTSEAAR